MPLNRRELLLSSLALGATSKQSWSQALSTAGQDLIVLLPGIAGSVLSKDAKEIWAPSLSGIGRALLTLGRSVDSLRLTADSETAEDLGDGIKADRLVSDIHLIPGLWKIDGYSRISEAITKMSGVRRGSNFFEFPYDWRRDNRVAAARLARTTHDWLNAWRRTSGNSEAKLVLLGHSMGGLVARYFLECLEGWRVTRTLVTFGTPYRGSLNAFNTLSNGTYLRAGGVVLADLSELCRSFTSVYQLLPTYPCVDAGAASLRRPADISGIPSVSAVRAMDAIKFHNEIEQAVVSNLKLQSYRENGYLLLPVVGTSQPTLQTATIQSGTVTFSTDMKGQQVDGDGTVPRPSATPLELSGKGRELYVSQLHGTLQNSPLVIDQVAGMLTGSSLDWEAFRTSQRWLSLSIPTILSDNENLILSGGYGQTIGRSTLAVSIDEVYAGKKMYEKIMITPKGDTYEKTIPPLPSGAYRLTVELTETGGLELRSISDVCVVVST